MEEELQTKKGRVIVRNLVFTLGEKQIRKLFEPHGEIIEVNLPINNENNQNKGFAFVQFKTRQEALNAIKTLNGSSYKGRTIAVDLSVPKVMYKQYEKETKKVVETPMQDVGEIVAVAKSAPKPEAHAKPHDYEKKKDKSHDHEKKKDKKPAAPVAEPTKEKKAEPIEPAKPLVKKKLNKFDEKTTLFVRNISFDTTEEDFNDYFSSYGELNYAKLCKNPETKMHKGTGFVQYKNEENAQRILNFSKQAEASYDAQKTKRNFSQEEGKVRI